MIVAVGWVLRPTADGRVRAAQRHPLRGPAGLPLIRPSVNRPRGRGSPPAAPRYTGRCGWHRRCRACSGWRGGRRAQPAMPGLAAGAHRPSIPLGHVREITAGAGAAGDPGCARLCQTTQRLCGSLPGSYPPAEMTGEGESVVSGHLAGVECARRGELADGEPERLGAIDQPHGPSGKVPAGDGGQAEQLHVGVPRIAQNPVVVKVADCGAPAFQALQEAG